MKLSDLNPLNLLRKKYPEKEVKMGDENKNPEQEINLQGQLPELEAFFGGLMKPYAEAIEHLQSDFDGFRNMVAELVTKLPKEDEVEQRGRERGLEEIALAFEQNAVEGEIEPFGRRIYSAFAKMGLLKESEEPEEVEEQQEETGEIPLPPYLRVISLEEREKLPEKEQQEYFGWTENHWAKLVEAV